MKFLIYAIFFFISYNLNSQLCQDYRILDGDETIVKYGMDTTNNWWAVTEPFQGRLRLIVNGEQSNIYLKLNIPTFSIDGSKWAAFGYDGINYHVLSNDTVITLNATSNGWINFNSYTNDLIYSYFVNDVENIIFPDRTISVTRKVGPTYLGPNNRYAFIAELGSQFVVNVNGKDIAQLDNVKPLGFWQDGTFLYAGKNGNYWAIYKNDKAITTDFLDITELTMNVFGTAATCLVKNFANKYQSVIISDDYYEPLMGSQFDYAIGLVLHPNLPMIGYKAMNRNINYIIYNNTEYAAGINSNTPKFSSSGEELYFLGCDVNCFVNINGRNYNLAQNIDIARDFAVKPNSKTLCYSTSTSLIILFAENKRMHAGMMVDEIIQPRYNRVNERYETLGRINNKLYMLTCRAN